MNGVTDKDFSSSPASTDTLFTVVYDELKRIARHHLRATSSTTLSTTELVHEAFLKLAGSTNADWDGRAHFFGAASRAMRQIVVDFARRRATAKRGSQPTLVSLSDDEPLNVELNQMLALDDALNELDQVDPRLRRVVELRFFCGLPAHDIAQQLGIGVRTVERDWFKARLFLLRELKLA